MKANWVGDPTFFAGEIPPKSELELISYLIRIKNDLTWALSALLQLLLLPEILLLFLQLLLDQRPLHDVLRVDLQFPRRRDPLVHGCAGANE